MKNTYNSRNSTWALLVILLLVLSWGQAQAAKIKGLYEANVVVANQGKTARNAAMQAAFAEVLVKVSGLPDVMSNEGVAKATKRPAGYVEQYQYREVPDDGRYNADRGSQLIWIRFDERIINSLLRKNGVEVWGKTRPALLMWVGVEMDGAQFLLSADSQEEMRLILEVEAQRSGLAVVLPRLDLEDKTRITFSDVWANVQERIFPASTRYGSEAIMVAQVNLAAKDIWQGRWILYEGGRGLSWSAQGSDLSAVIRSGVSGALEVLASVYRPKSGGGGSGEFKLTVTNLSDLTHYAKVTKYLDSLEQVKSVHPTHVNSDSASFTLAIRGSADGLIKTIGLGRVLRKMDTGGVQGGGSFTENLGAGTSVQIQETVPATAHVFQLLP